MKMSNLHAQLIDQSEKNAELTAALDKVLIEMQKHMGTDYPPVVSEAKQWLRAQGAVKAASTLGKLSPSRNLQAHSAGERVLAAAAALPGSRVQTDDKLTGCTTFGVGPKIRR